MTTPTDVCLVVEDDFDLVVFLKVILEKHFEVQLATRASEIDWEGPAPDVIILDLMLPEQSGKEVAGTIRETWPTTPIVGWTASGPERVEDFRTCVDVLLHKPSSPERIVTTLLGAIDTYPKITDGE